MKKYILLFGAVYGFICTQALADNSSVIKTNDGRVYVAGYHCHKPLKDDYLKGLNYIGIGIGFSEEAAYGAAKANCEKEKSISEGRLTNWNSGVKTDYKMKSIYSKPTNLWYCATPGYYRKKKV
ncbi:MAG TPA: hypothetical protein VKR58_14805 [Aquella sp.]|nr:hypothetical protein [Aquella sp.]